MKDHLILGKDFWEYRYKNNLTGWDIGDISPPIKAYIDQLENKDLRILIPGAGNAHEAIYLLEKGFTDITIVDIASFPILRLKEKFKNNPAIRLIEGDFFEHEGEYDLIIEQTFFCALSPTIRDEYVKKIKSLLSKNGKLVGLLFDMDFGEGPPFGGNKEEYTALFEKELKLNDMSPCYNSHPARSGNELWINLQKD